MKWLRLYSELPNDPKIRRIARRVNMPKMTIIGAWVTILSIASESPIRGELWYSDDCPLTTDDIVDELDIPPDTVVLLLSELESMTMISTSDDGIVSLPNWNKRQYKSDSSAERVKKYREKKAQKESDDDVTLQERFSNAPDTDTDTDTENRKQKKSQSKEKYPLPSGFEFPSQLKQSQAFMTVWDDWEKHRKELKKGLKPMTRKSQLKKAASHSAPDAIWVIEQSIENGWQGLFWDKLDKKQVQSGAGGSWKL